ncbi:BZ3500_MvSof-1268-A1-R1_Chr4-2g06972 [Microbotryum saponariae]|uniref:BZ3500_MvSof-1268-A1-R1_Chr4-2g06972 protein n=1 Tax=Microbotryum saponariae TaxID=289078 RepID=A0A2X0NLT8_9BASI|nr:BZ3500_MvSof-1268-A1-R1_Chr4-2g06972 [Microbotryum saponariae]SDA06637.1 BZ3501_MvSof-1269-A2-R1_Chr4-2g06683 [Microbotryum saponariae]
MSQVGAFHENLFIPGCTLTAVFYSATLLLERWLRHTRRIPGSSRPDIVRYGVLSCVFGFCGGSALLLISICDVYRHAAAHWASTLVFVLCMAASSICQTIQVRRLGSLLSQDADADHSKSDKGSHDGHGQGLKPSGRIKLVILVIALACALSFAVLFGACFTEPNTRAPSPRCNRVESASATFEWIVAFLFDFFLCTFILDLAPAVHRWVCFECSGPVDGF